jgi:DUF4097 and DUF4098 domain-containing protein YvlB
MTRYRFPLVALILLASGVPATAAVTRAAAAGDDTPRVTWLERYQDSRQGPEQVERFTETYKVPADGALDLQNISGDVRVTTGRNNEIRVEAVKRVRHRDANEAKRYLEQLRIEVTQVGNRVEVRTVYPRTMNNRSGGSGRSISASVDYTITVPVGGAVAAKSISGDVSVTGVKGEVRAETISGDVEVTSTPSLIVAKTVSGDVRARDIVGQTSITLSTISGTVIATGVRVRTLEVGSVSGGVQLSNLQVERLQAKNVSGDIEYDGALARGGRYEFSGHSGNVRLVVSNTTGFELDASTFSGSIRSDFPVTLHTTTRGDGRRGNSNRSVRGTFGDRGAILSIRSFSGTVVITKK